ncbi:phosphatase PAP2 family protein [Pluralibacter gergoviae]
MMKRFSLLALAVTFTLSAAAQEISLPDAGRVAAGVTPAAASPVFDALEADSLRALRQQLQGADGVLSRDRLEDARQSALQADKAWLKASDYDFAKKARQQAGITLLSGFSTLSPAVLAQNLETVTDINRDAPAAVRHQALADAEGIDFLYFLSDALGPRLGKAFITAYDKGELSKAAALIKASEVSTGAAKKHFHYDRPFLTPDNTIHLVPDDVVVKDNQPYTADGGSFPSGHTNTGVTDALLLAQMIPERYDALVIRGARYGYSRLVLGVHYPLDVMGSRMVAQSNVAAYLNDAKYRLLFSQARDQLRAALEKECGTSLAQCARPQGKDDPYSSPAMAQFYGFTMTYGFPAQAGAGSDKVIVPPGAEVLLESALPKLSAAQRRALMVSTALPAGYPLSGSTPEQQFWQRLNLVAAQQAAARL